MKNITESSITKLAGIALFSFLLAVPEILPAKNIEQAMTTTIQSTKSTTDHFTIADANLQKNLKDAVSNKQKIGNWNVANWVNALSRTVYAETRNQTSDGRRAVLTSILNRAGDNKDNIVPVISEYHAYSCWNGIKNKSKFWTDEGFVYSAPAGLFDKDGKVNPVELEAWEESKEFAVQVLMGKFEKSKLIGNANSYYNPDLVEKPNWDKDLTDIHTIKGKGAKSTHKFGYLKDQDPKFHGKRSVEAVKKSTTPTTVSKKTTPTVKTSPKTMNYVIKKGDTLYGIAKKYKTDVKTIAKLSGININSVLKPGQTIKVPIK